MSTFFTYFIDHNTNASNPCDQSTPIDDRTSFATRTCVYNGCFGCYSTHVSNELDEACKEHYKSINQYWNSYKCCVYTPDKCPVSVTFPLLKMTLLKPNTILPIIGKETREDGKKVIGSSKEHKWLNP